MKVVGVYYRTIRHYFPRFFQWVKAIPDWRDSKKSEYTVVDMVTTGLAIFLMKLGSRRGLNEQRGRKEFDRNVAGLLHGEKVAHGDSVNYFLKGLAPKYLEELRKRLVNRLIRNKVLSEFRVQGYYLVAFDATGSIQFRKRHCPYCLSRKLNNGERLYYHPILEAKIVCKNGLAISIGSEFLCNKDGNDRQDCEIKAFYRLAREIKREYPHLPICAVGDGLYAGEPTFKLCEELEWKYLTVLQDSDLPTVWEEVTGLRELMPDNHYSRVLRQPNGKTIQQECKWTLDINYHEQSVHVLEYDEQIEGKEESHWAWVTNFRTANDNCIALSQAGRRRWKIENEGFNIQKNNGYELEHVYSHNLNAEINFYLLMQIAHLIAQLVEKGSLIKLCFNGKAVSLLTIARDLLSEIKEAKIPWPLWESRVFPPFQIRFDTS